MEKLCLIHEIETLFVIRNDQTSLHYYQNTLKLQFGSFAILKCKQSDQSFHVIYYVRNFGHAYNIIQTAVRNFCHTCHLQISNIGTHGKGIKSQLKYLDWQQNGKCKVIPDLISLSHTSQHLHFEQPYSSEMLLLGDVGASRNLMPLKKDTLN